MQKGRVYEYGMLTYKFWKFPEFLPSFLISGIPEISGKVASQNKPWRNLQCNLDYSPEKGEASHGSHV